MYKWRIHPQERNETIYFSGFEPDKEKSILSIILGDEAQKLEGRYRLNDFKKLSPHEFQLIPE